MKKVVLLIVTVILLAVSCGSSKKSESDTAISADADVTDEDTEDESDEDEDYPIYDDEEDYTNDDRSEGWEKEPENGSPCENFANTDGMILYKKDGTFECGCIEGYFWGHLGCKKITYANICTGQKYCYDWYNYTNKCADAGNLSGQDPYYSREGYCLQPDFSQRIYYADEAIVFDNNLHIGWMNKVSDQSFTWDDAQKYCRNLKYGGKDDWRLPLPEELAVSPDNIGNHPVLWSSQALAKDQSSAWSLSGEQILESINKDSAAFVRCVRGKSVDEDESDSADSRFQTIEINGSEIIRDLKSGIIWQTYITKNLEWSDSMVFCEHSDFAGFSDWRLPNINELDSLVSYKGDTLSEFPVKTTILGPYFWSSTTNEKISDLPAYAIDIQTGNNINLSRASSYRVGHGFCMRNEPCMEGYWWTGVKCAKSPCDAKPCKKIKHSDGSCGTEDYETYYCGCDEGYFWNGEKCVNPCDEKPCEKHGHATGECRAVSDSSYICGCSEGFYWWGKNKGCLEKRPEPANICTGQTHCYDLEKKIKCPAEGEDFYGQDAQYAALGTCIPKNYKVNDSVEDEPTVYDFNTDLEWQQKVHTRDYWSWNQVRVYCNNLNYAGHDDWRLPTFDELRTILDFDASPLVSAEYFPDTPQVLFWTSSMPDDIHVYYVDFEDAFMQTFYLYNSQDRLWPSDVRCVRGETYVPEPRHMTEIKSGDDNLYGNSATGLLWKKIIMDKEERTTWLDRLARCENLVSDGLSDWRLPNFNELLSVSLDGYDIKYGSSSTTNTLNPERNFGDGYIKDSYEYYLVCVTENPCIDGEIWNGEKCVSDKCRHDVCMNAENSYKTCIPGGEGEPGYSCRCYEYYHWNSEKLKCVPVDDE